MRKCLPHRRPEDPEVISIKSAAPNRVFSFDLGEENLSQLAQITEAYLTTQLERGFSTLDFYKSLMI